MLYQLKGSISTLCKLKKFRKDILVNDIFNEFLIPKMR